MLFTSLKQHFPARFPEWVMSGIMATWGAYVILHPGLFTNPSTAPLFAGLASMSAWIADDPGVVWGLVSLVVGLLRACALFINGAYSRTPLVRLVSSFISAFIWTQIVIGLTRINVPNTGVVVYSWMVVIDLTSCWRAGQDLAFAENQRARGRVFNAARAGIH